MKATAATDTPPGRSVEGLWRAPGSFCGYPGPQHGQHDVPVRLFRDRTRVRVRVRVRVMTLVKILT